MVYCAAYNCTNGSASGWSMHSFPKNKTRLREWVRNMNRVQWKPTCHSKLCGRHFEERMFVISPSMARSVGYDMKSVRLREDAIPTIFDKLCNAKPKRISCLMEKLNRKRVCYYMSDNRVTLGENNWILAYSKLLMYL